MSSVDELDKETIKLLQNAFNSFDKGKKGYIETEMVQMILGMLGTEVEETELKAIIEEFDKEKTGQLQFEDFALLASRFMNEEEEEDWDRVQLEMKEVFRLYDKTGDGYITVEVLKEILSELDDKLTDDDLDNMIDEIDADGSGTVDWEEFLDIMRG